MLSSSFSRSVLNIRFTGNGIDKLVKLTKSNKGESLLHIAEKNGIHIPSACEGSGACATCHVYIEKGGNLLNEATDQENDTLDFAVDVHDNSRLACKALISADEGEMKVVLPKQSRNII